MSLEIEDIITHLQDLSNRVNDDYKEIIMDQIAMCKDYLDSGYTYAPVELRKKLQIGEFKHKEREFVQLEIFGI